MKKFLPIVFPSILVLVALFLCFKNFTPGTFLIGWDSLHPEFNFQEAFNRALNGVWRQEQGVGAIAAHSHMADWPRIVFIWLSSFVLPLSLLRYSYIFICLILGPLGVYFFLNYVFKRDSDSQNIYLASFLGGLYYLLNLGTLQHFLVPFEMFTTQYAFLPWLFFFALKVLREGKRKDYLIFAILAILSSPQAYAATLFYAYLGALTIFSVFYNFKRGFLLVLLSIALNLYWILPNAYSVVNQSNVVVSAKINQLFSPEAYVRNLSFSDLQNILIHRSFLFDWRVFDFEKSKFVDLIGKWNLDPLYVLASFSIFGVISTLFKKNKVGILLLAVSIYSAFFLLGLYPKEFLLGEALRMPFTKFSITFIFCLSFFFAYFFFKISKRLVLNWGLALIATFVLVSSTWFLFQGQLISPVVKNDFPSEYLEVFNWFKGREGRVSVLPLNSLWGWEYHSWNYEGSGFLTYGISNSILMRDFDRWSPYNESFYNEASFAIYGDDSQALKNTLQKYKVRYLFLDESIINPGGDQNTVYVAQTKDIIQKLGYKEIAKFNFLTVYDTGIEARNVFSPETYTFIDTHLTYSLVDSVYSKYGDYLQKDWSFGIPFVNFDPRGDVSIKIEGSNIELWNRKVNSKVTLPVVNLTEEKFGEGRGLPNAFNCDIEKDGSVQKQTHGNVVSYTAQNSGIACDFFTYPNLLYNQGYILRVRGENKEGRGLKIYLQNWLTGKMDLEELLPEGSFDQTYFIYPRNLEGGGYTLNLETRSFGKIASENLVSNIEFYPLDYDFLKKLTSGSGGETFKNNLKIKDVKKYGTSLYKVETEGKGILALSQGFENGWIAFSREGLKINILNHYKLNSWENAWEVDSDNLVFYIFFWPQALEWGGFIAIILTIILLAILPIRNKALK